MTFREKVRQAGAEFCQAQIKLEVITVVVIVVVVVVVIDV